MFSLCFTPSGGTMVLGGFDSSVFAPGHELEYTPSLVDTGWFAVTVRVFLFFFFLLFFFLVPACPPPAGRPGPGEARGQGIISYHPRVLMPVLLAPWLRPEAGGMGIGDVCIPSPWFRCRCC